MWTSEDFHVTLPTRRHDTTSPSGLPITTALVTQPEGPTGTAFGGYRCETSHGTHSAATLIAFQ